MDILFLSSSFVEGLCRHCSSRLLLEVFTKFIEENNKIELNNTHPNYSWKLIDFISNPSCPKRDLINVVVAFAYLGGFLMFDDGVIIQGDTNVLSSLLNKEHITKDDYDNYTYLVYKARNNQGVLFFDIENAPE